MQDTEKSLIIYLLTGGTYATRIAREYVSIFSNRFIILLTILMTER